MSIFDKYEIFANSENTLVKLSNDTKLDLLLLKM